MTEQARPSLLRLAGRFVLWLLIGYICWGIPYHQIMSSGASFTMEGVLLLLGWALPLALGFVFAYRVRRRDAASSGRTVLAALLGLAAVRALYGVFLFAGVPVSWHAVLGELGTAVVAMAWATAASAFGALSGSSDRRRWAWAVTGALALLVGIAWAVPYLLPRTVSFEMRMPGLRGEFLAEIAAKRDRPLGYSVIPVRAVSGPGPPTVARVWRYRLCRQWVVFGVLMYTEDDAHLLPPEPPPTEEEILAALPEIRADEGYRDAAEDLLARLRERFPEIDFRLDWTRERLEVTMVNFEVSGPPPAEPEETVADTLQGVIRLCVATEAPPTEELWMTFPPGDGTGQERGAWEGYRRWLGDDASQ